MHQRQIDKLKAIARELGAEPVGDRRKIQTWELAIERAVQSMSISLEAAYCPILRAIELAVESSPGVERVLELGVDRVQEPIELAVESSPGVDFAQELGVDFA